MVKWFKFNLSHQRAPPDKGGQKIQWKTGHHSRPVAVGKLMAAGPADQKLAQSVLVPAVHVGCAPHSCKAHMPERSLYTVTNQPIRSKHKQQFSFWYCHLAAYGEKD